VIPIVWEGQLHWQFLQNQEEPSFNPLLIFGGVGLGKTHLAHAIGVEIKEKYQDKTVLYIAAEKFTQQYIEAVKKKYTK
jgi:chromosomal replication initiator protein